MREFKALLIIQKMSVEEGALECGSGRVTVSTTKINAAQTTSKYGQSVLISNASSMRLGRVSTCAYGCHSGKILIPKKGKGPSVECHS